MKRMNIEKIQEKSIEYVKKNSDEIYSNLNVFEPVSKGYKQGYIDCLEDLEKRLELAKEIIEELVYIVPSSLAEHHKEMIDKARRYFKED